MAKQSLSNFLGKYNKAYKTYNRDNNEVINFISYLRNFYKSIDKIKPLGISEETYKDEFDKHILQKLYKNQTHKGISKNDLIIEKHGLTQVIMEFKQPINTDEMLQFNNDNINKKALHESIRYFYNQKSIHERQEIKHVVITDTDYFFFFDTQSFSNDYLEKICKKYTKISPQVADTRTKTQYKEIGEEINKRNIQFNYAEFNLKQYKDKILNNNLDDNDVKHIKYLYKALHSDFLLREFLPKDSNELNPGFYNELLYILGLKEERKKGKNGKNIIASDVKGTLRDNIYHNIDATSDNEKFKIAMQLIIVWLNRILFLKLFEAQLISFNRKEDKSKYSFLNKDKIRTFGDLKELFFNVLGKPVEERYGNKEEHIPYLNSSLFELSPIEEESKLKISDLTDNMTLQPYKGKGNPKPLLEYLLDFINSYNFSSNVSENNTKDIINSSVLGLVFEKLNGYKDGSFFTPAYVTEYMAKTSIDDIIISKYKEYKPDELCNSIEDLEDIIKNDNSFKSREDRRNFYSQLLFDNLKICDPAVGSGHFLVSVLNYIVHLKSKLKILPIPNTVEVQNDSLVIYESGEDNEDDQFKYNRYDCKTLEIQKVIFDEKRKIIENCLFGVDINPNSVEICRLRLWIELLKNTYYIDNTDKMQVLPNIDINIKCGNSLTSSIKFKIGKQISSSLDTKIAQKINEYKNLVREYKNSLSKNDKNKLKESIKIIYKYLKNNCSQQMQLLKDSIIKENLEKSGKISKAKYINIPNSLEWSIEFPEIIDEDGKFLGFDLIIGNPPYFNVQTYGAKHEIVDCLKTSYSEIWQDKSDILFYFIYRAYQLTKNKVYFIISNAFLYSDKADKLRNFIVKKMPIEEIINFEQYMIFNNASITSCISSFKKTNKSLKTNIINFKHKNIEKDVLQNELREKKSMYTKKFKENSVFSLEVSSDSLLNNKIDSNHKKLGDILKVGKGMETAANSVFCFKKYPEEFPKEFIKYRMSGEIISKYQYRTPIEYLLYYENIDHYNSLPLEIQKYLESNEEILKSRATVKNEGRIWWKYSRPLHKEYYHFNKIWCSYRNNKNAFVYDDTNQFIGLTNTTVIFGNNDKYNLKYILALLNSKLLDYRYKTNIGKQTGNGIYEYFENQITKLPIPEIKKEEQSKYANIVDKILEAIKADNYSLSLERQNIVKEYENRIDIMVYKLYNLTYDEVLIVDKDFTMSEEEYNNFNL